MLVSSIGFGWTEHSEQTNSSVAYPVSIHSLRWILFQRGMYFSHQWLIAYRVCVRFVMLLLHQGKWSTKILYLLVRKCANKFIYCVLREHLFQFKANKTMEEILPFFPPPLHSYFDKMSGCIHKNRMYVSFTCAEYHELSCKFYDKMSKMCIHCYYTVGSWTISDPCTRCSRRNDVNMLQAM